MSAHAEDIQKHIRVYVSIFAALLGLTALTVGVSYLHLSVVAGVSLAMAIAVTKGTLVGLFFMHLSDEVKTIYRVLLLCAAFLLVLMLLPTSWWSNQMLAPASVFDQQIPASRTGDPYHHDAGHAEDGGGHAEDHGGGH